MKLFGRKKYDNLVDSLAKREEDDTSAQTKDAVAKTVAAPDAPEKSAESVQSQAKSNAKEEDSVASLSGSFAMLGGAEIVFGGDPRSSQTTIKIDADQDQAEAVNQADADSSAEPRDVQDQASASPSTGTDTGSDSSTEAESVETKDEPQQQEKDNEDEVLAAVRKAAGLAPKTDENTSSITKADASDDQQQEDAMTDAEKAASTATSNVDSTEPSDEKVAASQVSEAASQVDDESKDPSATVKSENDGSESAADMDRDLSDQDSETEDQVIDASNVDFSALEAEVVESDEIHPIDSDLDEEKHTDDDTLTSIDEAVDETNTDTATVDSIDPAPEEISDSVQAGQDGVSQDTAASSSVEQPTPSKEQPVASTADSVEVTIPEDPDRELTEPVAPSDTENEEQPVSVQQSQTLVNATISQQYNNVLSQNSLLLSQIERMQGVNDKLNKQISRWQEYRNEATGYINNITIKSQDQVLKLKKNQEKELDDVNEAWLQKFDERSAEVDRKYQEFEKRIQGIIATESQEKADLQDQITKLQKDNMTLDSEVTTRGFKINELTASLDELKQSNEDLEAAKRELTDELSKAVNDLNIAAERSQSATNEVAVLKKENADWKDNLAQAKVESLNAFNKSESRMGATIAELTEKLAKAESDKQQSQNKYSASLQRQHELESTVSDLNKQNKTLLDQISEMEAGDTKDYMSVPTFENDFPQM
ncbi:hypothetical protein [Furfurilactobacillus curtus]|uniref:Uncharacterized protein n=1 Tax=Furfurilactobacillus curtus TaxID=1746200 RepID=A0ABQ5JPW3_9LACO